MRISRRLELYRRPLPGGTGTGRFTGRWTPPPPQRESLAAAWGRAIAAGLFVVVLTLWQFYQFVALEDGPACDRLGRAVQALADLDRLWVTAFLVALVLGVCGYSFSRLFPRRHHPLRPLSRHHAWHFALSPVLFQFFVGIFFFGMTFRIFSAFLAATMSAGPAPWWVMHVPWLSEGAAPRVDPSAPFYLELGRMVFLAGILATLWAVGFAVHTLRLLGGRRGPAAVVLLLLVVAAWAVPALELTPRLPSPIPAGILDGIDDSPALARLLASSSEPPPGAVRDARIFLDSRRVRRARRESNMERYRNNCEECLLPRTVLLAPEGIRVRIRGGAVEASSPAAVLEIPRGGHEIRFLDPATAGILRRIPVARLGTECPGGDWVVLRADGKLPMRAFRGISNALAACGVRRLSLAAWPVDAVPLPGVEPLLSFEPPGGDVPLLELAPRPRQPWVSSRRMTVTFWYREPEQPVRQCGNLRADESCFDALWLEMPPSGSVGERVAIALRSRKRRPPSRRELEYRWLLGHEGEPAAVSVYYDGMYGPVYQQALTRVTRAAHGGARKIYIEIEQEQQ